MPFYLARERRGQDSDWIQRFDPRFWTVNFPRPMMASVVTTAPDGLRVECEFHHAGELAGLIWDSADGLDHPLLAYATDRDYSRTTLSFRWRSGGVIALDAVHGPTLTIEGRDAAGNPRSWFVRLWNYASGSPEDAQVTLPFSALQSASPCRARRSIRRTLTGCSSASCRPAIRPAAPIRCPRAPTAGPS